MPCRKDIYNTFRLGCYGYGFNGKENDNEIKGTGNQQDYGFRIYDPRLGRFLSMDPLTKGYPELTPFQFASNEPISNIDLDGLERSPAGKVGQNEEIVRDNTAVALYPNEIPVILKQQENAPKLRVLMDAAARPMETVEDRNKALFRSISNPDNIGGNAAFGIYSDLHNARAEYSEGNYGMGTLRLFNAGINTVTLTGAGPALGAKGNTKIQTEFLPPVVKAQINSRHILSSSVIARSNKTPEVTTLAPRGTLEADLAAYNAGNFTRALGGGVLVNGNSYGIKNEGGTLYPISGKWFVNVTAGQLQTVMFYKTLSGNSLQKALDGAKVSDGDRQFAQDFIKKY